MAVLDVHYYPTAVSAARTPERSRIRSRPFSEQDEKKLTQKRAALQKTIEMAQKEELKPKNH